MSGGSGAHDGVAVGTMMENLHVRKAVGPMMENLHVRKEQGKAEMQNTGKAAWNPEQHLERSNNRLLLGVSCFS